MAKNKVVAGDYQGYAVKDGWSSFTFNPPLFSQNSGSVVIDKSTVLGYEIITDEHRRNAVSGIARGLIGGYLFGSAGTLGGTMSAKNRSIYTIAVDFHDGKRSLIEIDEKKYKAFIKSVF